MDEIIALNPGLMITINQDSGSVVDTVASVVQKHQQPSVRKKIAELLMSTPQAQKPTVFAHPATAQMNDVDRGQYAAPYTSATASRTRSVLPSMSPPKTNTKHISPKRSASTDIDDEIPSQMKKMKASQSNLYTPIPSFVPTTGRVVQRVSLKNGMTPKPNGHALTHAEFLARRERETGMPIYGSQDEQNAGIDLSDNDTSIIIPASGGNTIQGLSAYSQPFNNMYEATQATSELRRQPNVPRGEDDVHELILNAGRYTQIVYEAIRSTPANPDPHQLQMIADFEAKIQVINSAKSGEADRVCSRMAAGIVRKIADLHISGDGLRPDQIDCNGYYTQEQALTASTLR